MVNSSGNRIFAYVLVVAQFTGILFFLFQGSLFNDSVVLQAVQGLALLIGIISVYYMRLRNFRISPIPKDNAVLIKNGPYRWVRHPMYTAVLLFCAARMLSSKTVLSVLVFLILCGILLIKISFEEKLMQEKFKSYSVYMTETKRLVPFIY